jgi:cell division protein FtsW
MAIVMILALYMSKYEKPINSTHKFGGSFQYGFFMPMVFIGILCVLIALERHISGLMIVGALGLCIMFLGGTRMRYLVSFVGIMIVAGVFLIAVSSYAQERVAIWLRLEELDPRGEAWQTLQGLYAIGSGGFFGKGLGNSAQKVVIPEAHNDMILSIICEELGVFGAIVLLLMFGMLLYRLMFIAQNAPDMYGSLMVTGIFAHIALQVIFNVAVVLNVIPTTGITLPFVSYGGTSTLFLMAEMGIALGVSNRIEFDE